MRIFVHEFGGYSFPLQLSRELAFRGHEVIHAYATGLPGPKGRLQKAQTDSDLLTICPVALSGTFRKYSPVRRFLAQRTYSRDLKTLITQHKPQVVLSADTPIDVQAELLLHCKRNGIAFVHWVQDVYCQAIEFLFARKIKSAARALSYPFRLLEVAVANRSDHVIAISPAFRDIYARWGVDKSKISIMENWAPLNELPLKPRDNAWSEKHGLHKPTVFLYSGTLGLKHRPDLLYQLAQAVGPDHKVVVVTEGAGRSFLENQTQLPNLKLLDFQPYAELPEVLASADVLVAMLDPSATDFAVPSKILTYLCANKPILMASPTANLSHEVITRSGGGIAVDPADTAQWINAAKLLADNEPQRTALGARGRQYAEAAFDISAITQKFETILQAHTTSAPPKAQAAVA